MKYGKFNNDGWCTSEYTGIIYGTVKLAEQNVFIIPDEIPENLAFYDGTEVTAKTQADRDTYDTEQANAVKLARTVFSQLQIREAFKALNKEADLNALLSGNPTFQTYWQEAQEIDLEHPVTAQALASFTEAEIEAIKLNI